MKNSCFDGNEFKATMNKVRSKSKEILGRKSLSLAKASPLIKFADDMDVSKLKKNYISHPCAFQHINSLKNGDIRLLVDNKKLKL